MVETAVVKLPVSSPETTSLGLLLTSLRVQRNELLIIQDTQVQPDENLWIFVPTGEKDTYLYVNGNVYTLPFAILTQNTHSIADIHKQTYWILVGQSKDKVCLRQYKKTTELIRFHQALAWDICV